MTEFQNESPNLTIGMATYDDYDGVYFSIQSIRMHHPEVLDPCELLVVDNNPGSISSRMIKDVAALVPLLYLAFNEISGTAVKDMVIREARGKYLLCMDCHVMYPPGTLARLLKYFDQHPDTRDLLQGPL